MNHTEFAEKYPVLSRAAWDMFCDGGGSEMVRNDFNDCLNRILPQLTEADLNAAEIELAAIRAKNPDYYWTAIGGELWDMLLICSNTLEWVLNMLFGEDAQTRDEFMKSIAKERAKIPADYKFGTNSGFTSKMDD